MANIFEEKYQNKLKSENFELYPKTKDLLLQLEVTNICNHRCIFCPNHESKRKKRLIDKDFALRIIKECADIGIKKMCYHMNGESLLYPDLVELVNYAKSLGYTYTFITTNGSIASEELLKKLFDAGLDSIKFSINAGTEESYQKIHGKSDYQKAINALKFSYNYRKETGKNYKIFTSFVVTKYTADEVEEFYNEIKEYNDDILFYHLCSYAGQAFDKIKDIYVNISDKDVPVFDITHTMPCAVLINSINVTCEGYLSICCSEANNYMIIEDLNKKSIKEAWYGDRMVNLREKHLRGEIEDTPCNACIYGNKGKLVPVNEELYKESFSILKKNRIS